MGWAWKEPFNNGGLAGSCSQSVQKSGTIGWIVDVLRVWADVRELPGVTHETGLKIEIEHAWNLLLPYPAQTLKQQGLAPCKTFNPVLAFGRVLQGILSDPAPWDLGLPLFS